MDKEQIQYAISISDSGDLVKDGFKSEGEAYQWLMKHFGDDIVDFVVEKQEEA